MKVGEFIEKAKGKENLDLVIRKDDKHQLTCHTTVNVKDAVVGFDWTNNQLVLIPSVKLSTSQVVVEQNMRKALREEASRCTRHLQLAAKLARMIQEIENEELRERIHAVLKEF